MEHGTGLPRPGLIGKADVAEKALQEENLAHLKELILNEKVKQEQ